MKKWVSNDQKRNFLTWFLQQHQLKNKEVKIVFDQFIRNHHLLEKLHFTDHIVKNKKTIVISSYHSDEPGFLYYSNNQKYEHISKVLDDLNTNPSTSYYLLLNFNGKSINQRYLSLVESDTNDRFQEYKRFVQYEKDTNQMIDELLKQQNKDAIRQKIDEALDNRDKVLFNKLVSKLHELNEQKNDF
ncbi:YpiB family protein [Alkalihalobacillus trypoxylicola]|uniref:IDEAL domain-containing protein n=1 Tax=Alkalihalobacillus trypoxylicola TaxID=519424 RepID=A0A161PBX3_9BACI|nr:YpiB family protein [Alkalihalobacillus trypoxylicola]KYG29319.1 hypothetical protein AZF04_07270 [Alkalihalobacillus trypoxylicola]